MSKFLLSVDDACASDVRVAELARKYNIETTFYWPVEHRSLAYEKGYEPLSYSQQLEISKLFDIGSHTLTHRHLTKLPYEEAIHEILESKHILVKLFNNSYIRKFCPPRGYTNKELTEFTLKHYESQRLTKGEGLVHIHPKSGANNNMPWREYAKTIEVKEFWGHSYEWDRCQMWDDIEAYFKEHA